MWPPSAAPFGSWARPTGPVRIGDAERDSAVSALGDHFAAGRLTREEFDERIDKAMQARFQSDLQPLFADLPGPAVERLRQQAGLLERLREYRFSCCSCPC